MKNKVPIELIKVIEGQSHFCLLSHADPDGDCVGSELALAHYLRRLGKQVGLFSPGPFDRPEIRDLAPQFSSRIDPKILTGRPVIIVLDCSSIERIGDLSADIEGLTTIVIDHHSSGRKFGDIEYIDATAPSVTLLVQNVIEQMGNEVDEEEARWIFFGFCTDTGFFRHIDSGGDAVFESVARLNRAGATPKQIYRMIYGGRALEARLLLGILLARTEERLGGKVLLTYETAADKQRYGKDNRDSDSLYQYLQTVVGCEVVVFIREERESFCSVGLRSNAHVDVGAIAKGFGGGGHVRAAGFELEATRRQIEQQLLAVLADAFT